MKPAALFFVLALVVTACGASPDLVVTAEPLGAASDDVVTPVEPTTPVPDVPGTAPSPDAMPELPTPDDAAADGVDAYLLTQSDLPGWEFTGSMSFPGEPTLEVTDCDLMNTAWAAHAQPGIRARAASPGVNIRHTVVEMPDEASATAVLDAVDVVWEQCTLFETNLGTSWLEPLEIEAARDWRTAGLAIGLDNQTTWIIGYWQQGSTIVFLDVDGANPWNSALALFAAVSGRLTGTPMPAPAPTPDAPRLVQPTSTPVAQSPTPSPTLRPRVDWTDDPLAALVLDASELGEGWEFDYGSVTQASEGGPDEYEDCDAVEPPSPAGIEVSYRQGNEAAIEVTLQSTTVEGAVTIVSAFRELTSCDLSEDGIELEQRDFNPDGADDALLFDAVSTYSTSEEAIVFYGTFALAAYDGLVVSIFWSGEDDPRPAAPTSDDFARWLDAIVAKR